MLKFSLKEWMNVGSEWWMTRETLVKNLFLLTFHFKYFIQSRFPFINQFAHKMNRLMFGKITMLAISSTFFDDLSKEIHYFLQFSFCFVRVLWKFFPGWIQKKDLNYSLWQHTEAVCDNFMLVCDAYVAP